MADFSARISSVSPLYRSFKSTILFSTLLFSCKSDSMRESRSKIYPSYDAVWLVNSFICWVCDWYFDSKNEHSSFDRLYLSKICSEMDRVEDWCSGANASLDSSSFAYSSGSRNFLHRSTVSASLSSCYWIKSNSACSYNLANSAASYFFFSRSRSICSSLDWPDFFWETSFSLSWINRFSFLITYNSC